MLFTPRLTGRPLAEFCHRLGVQLESGIDIRKVWDREVRSAPSRLRPYLEEIGRGIKAGDPLNQSCRRAAFIFPTLFLQMVDVGENTGMISEVFHRLSNHYQRQFEMSRSLRARLAWPLMQLAMALFVVGILIYVMGMIGPSGPGQQLDILGWGLTGASGLFIYLCCLLLIVGGVGGLLWAARRGVFSTKAIEHWAMQVPGLRPLLESLCLARLTWAMHLTLNVDLDLRKLVPLVLRTAGNDYYACQSDTVVQQIISGRTISQAFLSTGIFPHRLTDAIAVGEESGRLVEAMGRLSKQYESEADLAMKKLAMLVGTAVWVAVAILIILLIFRIFSFYLSALQGI